MSGEEAASGDPAARGRSGRRFVLVAYGLATLLSVPHYVFGRVLDLGLVMGWLAPAFLLLALRGASPFAGARQAFVASLIAHGLVFHWFFVVTVSYGHMPSALGLLTPLAPSLYVSLSTAAFAAGWLWLRDRGYASPFAAALLWTALDHLRSFALGGFPWATLGYSQLHNPALMGLASFTGVYGISFALVLGGAALGEGWVAWRARRRPGWPVLGALATVVVLHVVGAGAASRVDLSAGQTLRVAALQGNIDQGMKWSQEWAEEILDIYLDLSRRAAREGAEVIVWPETAVPGLLEVDERIRAPIARLARETGATFVLGATGVVLNPERTRILHYFDSAFSMDPRGEIVSRYDKTHLVPFGEFVPLRSLLGMFFQALATGIAGTDVTAGEAPRALALPRAGQGAGEAGGERVMVGIPICYELLFPDLVRRFVGDGARVLLAITNDAWYGRTGAPYQFVALTAMRSAESGVWTVRAANTGVSAVIDARGRVREQTAIFERSYLVADVPLLPPPNSKNSSKNSGKSFYVRYGDLFAGACWLAVAVLALGAGFRPRGSGPGEGIES
jgi:apolipoprotein N-acyltransferase